jgi:hypothetical protein
MPVGRLLGVGLRVALAGVETPPRLALHEGALRRFLPMAWHAVPARVRRPVMVNFALGLSTVAVAAWGRFGG